MHARALLIMRKACKEEQKLNIHCFMGECELVREWMTAFPNVHFGFTAAVQKFDREQIQALCWKRIIRSCLQQRE
ncbi:hypothetical protein FSP39_022730 [Pinctada imbricata]|uniref:Uncharacterized protein n=1 Tax=Pinctada imbricata TaxID=66713 RepID=A0AA88YUH1_PINIB|nr:hypothetical protein FSP39_022730 [Pinctada imbricata]